jgi:hypothetical protein
MSTNHFVPSFYHGTNLTNFIRDGNLINASELFLRHYNSKFEKKLSKVKYLTPSPNSYA